MSSGEQYAPGAASGAEVRKDGEKWTLVLVRDLPHPPERVWKALTDGRLSILRERREVPLGSWDRQMMRLVEDVLDDDPSISRKRDD